MHVATDRGVTPPNHVTMQSGVPTRRPTKEMMVMQKVARMRDPHWEYACLVAESAYHGRLRQSGRRGH